MAICKLCGVENKICTKGYCAIYGPIEDEKVCPVCNGTGKIK